jgi:hypothetical protein
VRHAAGYLRYDSLVELKLLNALYNELLLLSNYFQPVMKLVRKERVGSRVKKHYDRPKTPYQRVLESSAVPETVKLP